MQKQGRIPTHSEKMQPFSKAREPKTESIVKRERQHFVRCFKCGAGQLARPDAKLIVQ